MTVDTEKLGRAIARSKKSIKQLADKAEISRQTIWRALRGGGLRMDTVERICRAIGVDMWDVINDSEV